MSMSKVFKTASSRLIASRRMRQHTAKLLDEAKRCAAQSRQQRANVMSLMTENYPRRPSTVDATLPAQSKDPPIPDAKSRETHSQDLNKTLSRLSLASNGSETSNTKSSEQKAEPVSQQKRIRNKHGLSLTFGDRCKGIR